MRASLVSERNSFLRVPFVSILNIFSCSFFLISLSAAYSSIHSSSLRFLMIAALCYLFEVSILRRE